MNRICSIASIVVFAAVAFPALAEDATGTWKWTVTFNNNTREATLKLKQEGEKLTGTMLGRNNQETPIDSGTIKDDKVSFSVTREFNGQKFTQKYSGTLKGDSITGKVETEGGQVPSRDWEAKRQK